MSGFNAKKAYLSVIIETTRGSIIANSSAQTNIRLNPGSIKLDTEIQTAAMLYAAGDYAAAARVLMNRPATFSFDYPMQPGAGLGIAPNGRKLFLMSGHRETVTLTVSTALIASNSTIVTLTVGGSATSTIATVFTTDAATTMEAIAVKVRLLTGVESCTVSGTSLLIVTNSQTGGGLPLVWTAATTLGASQPTWTTPSVQWNDDETKDEISASMYLTLVPVSGNAVVISLKGCMANVTHSMASPGSPILASVKGQGAFAGIDDVSATVLGTLNTTTIPSMIQSAFTFASETTAQVLKFDFDPNRKLDYEYSNSDATGILAARITEGFEPAVKFSLYSKLLATEAHWNRFRAGTVHSVSVVTPTNGTSKFGYLFPNFQITKIGHGESEGYNTWDIEGVCLKETGVRAFTIIQN